MTREPVEKHRLRIIRINKTVKAGDDVAGVRADRSLSKVLLRSSGISRDDGERWSFFIRLKNYDLYYE